MFPNFRSTIFLGTPTSEPVNTSGYVLMLHPKKFPKIIYDCIKCFLGGNNFASFLFEKQHVLIYQVVALCSFLG